MPIATCPGCGRKISLTLEEMQIRIECAKCGHKFVALGPPESISPGPAPEQTTSAPKYDYEAPTRSNAPLLIALSIGVLTFIVLCSGILIVAAHRDRASTAEAPPTPVPSRPAVVHPPSQTEVQPPPISTGEGFFLLGIGFFVWGCICVGAIVYALVVIFLLAWVAKDARSRGTDGAIWVIVILLSGVVGFIVYLLARPAGMLTVCPRCANNRLMASRICPHCGDTTAV